MLVVVCLLLAEMLMRDRHVGKEAVMLMLVRQQPPYIVIFIVCLFDNFLC